MIPLEPQWKGLVRVARETLLQESSGAIREFPKDGVFRQTRFAGRPDELVESAWFDMPSFIAESFNQQPAEIAVGESSTPHIVPEQVFELFSLQARDDLGFYAYNLAKGGIRNEIDEHFACDQAAPSYFAELSSKATLIVRSAGRFIPEVEKLQRFFRDLFSCDVNINLYLSQEKGTGFPVHADDHHVFAIQAYGEKQWVVWPPIHSAPMSGFCSAKIKPPGEPRRFVTRVGNCLYIPNGWLHQASSISDHSIHLTVGMEVPRWFHLFQRAWLVLAGQRDSIRSPLQIDWNENGTEWSVDDTQLEVEMEAVVSEWKKIVRQEVQHLRLNAKQNSGR